MTFKINTWFLMVVLISLASPAFAKEYTVRMVTVPGPEEIYRFEPDTLTIEPGDTVNFVNAQDDKHNVMFEEVPDGADFATSPMLKKEGQKWSHTFTQEGTYKYHCHPHADWGMKGVIIVGDASAPEKSKKDVPHRHDHHEMNMNMDQPMQHSSDMNDIAHAGMPMEGFYGFYPMTREAASFMLFARVKLN